MAEFKTLVVNLFAGPGSGKSTLTAGVFFDLKMRGINCEMSLELAKELVYELRYETFKDQIYIFGEQYHRIHRLLGKVEVIITDCPLLLTVIYDQEKRPELRNLVVSEHKKMWTYNVFVKRIKKFNPRGRLHNEIQAMELDRQIIDELDAVEECYEVVNGDLAGRGAIVKKVMLSISNNK